MLNLLITYDKTAWSSSPTFMDLDRCLTEYISSELKEKYSGLSKDAIDELKNIPCIFTYEKCHKSDAYIGFIKNILINSKSVRIDYELTGQEIAFDDLMQVSNLLNIGIFEWNRTH